MIALIRPVAYLWPALTSEVRCSETLDLGSIHDTAGSARSFTAVKKLLRELYVAACFVLSDIKEQRRRIPDTGRPELDAPRLCPGDVDR
jgi:hypothetical protein